MHSMFDDTLEVSGGPVTLAQLIRLRSEGHVIGLCGNWAVVTSLVRGWHNLLSFIGPIGCHKTTFLQGLRMFIKADRYVMVGNEADRESARLAEFEFVLEHDFIGGR